MGKSVLVFKPACDYQRCATIHPGCFFRNDDFVLEALEKCLELLYRGRSSQHPARINMDSCKGMV